MILPNSFTWLLFTFAFIISFIRFYSSGKYYCYGDLWHSLKAKLYKRFRMINFLQLYNSGLLSIVYLILFYLKEFNAWETCDKVGSIKKKLYNNWVYGFQYIFDELVFGRFFVSCSMNDAHKLYILFGISHSILVVIWLFPTLKIINNGAEFEFTI